MIKHYFLAWIFKKIKCNILIDSLKIPHMHTIYLIIFTPPNNFAHIHSQLLTPPNYTSSSLKNLPSPGYVSHSLECLQPTMGQTVNKTTDSPASRIH